MSAIPHGDVQIADDLANPWFERPRDQRQPSLPLGITAEDFRFPPFRAIARFTISFRRARHHAAQGSR